MTTTLTQTKPQAQATKRLDAVDGQFDAIVGLPPKTNQIDYHLGYLKALREADKAPF